jgi:hypothetical protein
MSDTTTSNPTLTEKQRYWMEHIQTAEAQKISLASYAKSNQLDLKALYNWKWILGKKGFIDSDLTVRQELEFTQVRMATHSSAQLSVLLSNGVRLEIHQGLSAALLREFVYSIGQLP